MPNKRVVVNLSEKYDDIRIPRSLLPADNSNVYSEQVILYMSPPHVEDLSQWDMQHDGTNSRTKNNVNANGSAPSVTAAGGLSSWTPTPLLGEQDTARASLAYMMEPPRSPIMRGRLSRSPGS